MRHFPLALILVLPSILFAAAPSGVVEMHVSRLSFPIADSRDHQTREQEGAKFDPFEATFFGAEQSDEVTGMRLEGRAVHLGTISFREHYREVKLRLKTTQKIPVPRTVRKEKNIFGKRIVYDEPTVVMEDKTIISDLDTAHDTSATLVSLHEIVLPLPQRIDLVLAPVSGGMELKVADREQVRRFLVDQALYLMSDAEFDRYFRISIQNPPLGDVGQKLFEVLKPKLREELRRVVERELSKPEFLDRFVQTLTKRFSGFPHLGSGPLALVAEAEPNGWSLHPKDRAGGLDSILLPRVFDGMTAPNSGSLVLDGEGMSGLLAAYLRSGGASFSYDAKKDTAFFQPHNEGEARELLAFFSQVVPVTVKAVHTLELPLDDKHAPEVVPWVDEKTGHQFVDFTGTLRLVDGSGAADDTRWTFTFGAEPNGLVKLDTVKAEGGRNAIPGRQFPSALGMRLKWLLLKSLINEKLAAQMPAHSDAGGVKTPIARLRLIGDNGEYGEGNDAHQAAALAIDFQMK